jgi:hypothetical protein
MPLCFNSVKIMYYIGPVLPADLSCVSQMGSTVSSVRTQCRRIQGDVLSILGSFLVWVLRTLQDRLQGFDKSNRNTLVVEMLIN